MFGVQITGGVTVAKHWWDICQTAWRCIFPAAAQGPFGAAVPETCTVISFRHSTDKLHGCFGLVLQSF